MTHTADRRWAGTTLDDRRSARRQQLLDVGLELLGTGGSSAVTVRAVCRQAKLTDRYFYESFVDRDELLIAVYDDVAAQASAVLTGAVQTCADAAPDVVLEAAVTAFLGLIDNDPRIGRILLLEPMTDATLTAHARGTMSMFVDLIRTQLGASASPFAAYITATAVVGALSNLIIRWLEGTLIATRAQLARYCVALLAMSIQLAADTTKADEGSGDHIERDDYLGGAQPDD